MSEWGSWDTKCDEILAQFGIPFDKNRFKPVDGSDQLPGTYIVYFQVDAPGSTYYEGKVSSRDVKVQVSLHSVDEATIKQLSGTLETAFLDAGFCYAGEGTIPYQTTGHNGWHCDFTLHERR